MKKILCCAPTSLALAAGVAASAKAVDAEAAFWRTPPGVKMPDSMPGIKEESMRIVTTAMRSGIVKIIEKYAEVPAN